MNSTTESLNKNTNVRINSYLVKNTFKWVGNGLLAYYGIKFALDDKKSGAFENNEDLANNAIGVASGIICRSIADLM